MSSGSSRSENPPIRLHLQSGYFAQEFSGVAGSSADKLTGYHYTVGAYYGIGYWDIGAQYSMLQGITISPFIFSNGSQGDYKIDVKRIQLLTGPKSPRWRAHLIVGQETAAWSGTPDLGSKVRSDIYFGGKISYDLFKRTGIGTKFSFPLELLALYHGAREYQFTNYPNETVTVNAGFETQFNLGVAFDF